MEKLNSRSEGRPLPLDRSQEACMKIQRKHPHSSLIRWVPPDQPGSAPAFHRSCGNRPVCLVSGSSLSSWRTHKTRRPTVCQARYLLFAEDSPETLAKHKYEAGPGVWMVGPGRSLSFSPVAIVSPASLLPILKVDAFQQNPLTTLPWTTACFPFCVWI